jgi:hypothetical protein
MVRTSRILLIGAAALAAACTEKISSTSPDSSLLDAAFTSTPVAFEGATSSFANSGSATTDSAFTPGHGPRGGHGPNGLPGGFDFMGGGLGLDFLGGPFGGGRPFDHGALASSCSFDSSRGVITCSSTRNGIATTRTERLTTASGAVQSAPDSSTNSSVVHTSISGTRTRRDSSATTTVAYTSDRTVAGLASGSTQRTVNGTSAGTESTSGRDTAGAFTATRAIGDTVSGVVVPIANGRPSYPTAGTVVRAMTATLTYAGQAATTRTRREVVTYDGTATAKLVITQDGTTKTCTIPLPHGRPSCS